MMMSLWKTMIAISALTLLVTGLPASASDRGWQAGGFDQNVKGEPTLEYERLLVPVTHDKGVPGRFDSLWVGELLAHNSADVAVRFFTGTGVSPFVGLIRIAPGGTVLANGDDGEKGEIYLVEKEHADQIHLSLRIADVNRRPASQGSAIPVVRERDWLARPVVLLDIPTDFSVRQTLRVYDPEGTNQASVRVTIYPLAENELLADAVLEPRGGTEMIPAPGLHSGRPSYAEISDLVEAFPQLATHERLQVRIEPLTPGMRFWAFITITDNMTQQVSVIAPQ